MRYASAALSRRVEKVVGYPPLSEVAATRGASPSHVGA
jgi:hypothetical protein